MFRAEHWLFCNLLCMEGIGSPRIRLPFGLRIQSAWTHCVPPTSLRSNPNTSYLWLDRGCIIQSSKEDRSWQMQHMGRIYKNCSTYLVLPGGLGRLVGLAEETAWIHRSWTLQEALSPRTTKCLFRWEQPPAEISGLTAGNIEGVENNHSAMMLLTI